jgi:hypothetical protein
MKTLAQGKIKAITQCKINKHNMTQFTIVLGAATSHCKDCGMAVSVADHTYRIWGTALDEPCPGPQTYKAKKKSLEFNLWF